ncbi:MAG: lysophospholipid acyltransferase family protein [Paracoccus sp. (in: a-proteobacteria)]|nr:lysophospholipid acyltransferase family protein [Paracoccus sp. (in: a-proteobacteria)]
MLPPLLSAEQAAAYDPKPGRTGIFAYPRAVLYYIHIALATVVLGLWGLTQIGRGRPGAHHVATTWIGYMLLAARWHLGVAVEQRGTAPTEDCIVAAKHQSFLDILAIAYACRERGFIMKREVLRVPIMGWYARKAGCIPIDRARGRDAMTQILAEIAQRRADEGLGHLIIYPEGTRTKPGERRPYKHGVATIYAGTGLPCHPVAVNCGMFWPRRGIPIRPGRAVIEFLPVIAPGLSPDALVPELREQIETASDRLMAEAGLSLPGPDTDRAIAQADAAKV